MNHPILCLQVMNQPVGFPPPKPLPGKKRLTRLNLRRSKPRPDPEEEIANHQTGQFWRWVAVVAIFHVAVIMLAIWIYRNAPAPPPPVQFISLLPQGQAVKGTPGVQAAPKVGTFCEAVDPSDKIIRAASSAFKLVDNVSKAAR